MLITGCIDSSWQRFLFRKCVSVCVSPVFVSETVTEGNRCALAYLCADLSMFCSSRHRIACFHAVTVICWAIIVDRSDMGMHLKWTLLWDTGAQFSLSDPVGKQQNRRAWRWETDTVRLQKWQKSTRKVVQRICTSNFKSKCHQAEISQCANAGEMRENDLNLGLLLS